MEVEGGWEGISSRRWTRDYPLWSNPETVVFFLLAHTAGWAQRLTFLEVWYCFCLLFVKAVGQELTLISSFPIKMRRLSIALKIKLPQISSIGEFQIIYVNTLSSRK